MGQEVIEGWTLAPSALVLDTMRLGSKSAFGYSATLTSWEFSFKVPENRHPNKLVVPEVADIDLVGVVARYTDTKPHSAFFLKIKIRGFILWMMSVKSKSWTR